MNPDQPTTESAEPVREHLRDVSLETVDHVRTLNLSLFIEKGAELSEAEANRQILALIWLLHHDNDEDAIAASVEAGRAWQDIAAFKREPAALWAFPEVVPAVRKVKSILSRNHFLAAAEASTDGDAAL